MKIAVFGTGVVGQTIAEKLSSLKHEVIMGTRDVKATLERNSGDGKPGFKNWLDKNASIKINSYSEAAKSSDIIVNATSGKGSIEALSLAGKENLSGKIILDISNPLDFSKGMPPTLFICNDDSLAEQIQRTFADAKVVKSLNTMTAAIMVNPSLVNGDHNVFVSGNDNGAKAKVKELLASFGWKEKNMIDLGDITTARGTEQLLPVWIRLWGSLQTPMFNFHIVKNQ